MLLLLNMFCIYTMYKHSLRASPKDYLKVKNIALHLGHLHKWHALPSEHLKYYVAFQASSKLGKLMYTAIHLSPSKKHLSKGVL